MSYKFPRTNRLTSKHDFQSVFASANKVSHRALLALFHPNQKPHARLGIITPKQHLKLAVERNRMRRMIRESFRQHKEALKGLDIIVLIRSKCTPLDEHAKHALREEINHLWQKIKTVLPC